MPEFRTVIVTGLHSGPNPSPGLGIARSLKSAWPKVLIVGIDYSPSSSGLHNPLLDQRLLLPSWAEGRVSAWAEVIADLLDDEATCYIPGLDLEARLASELLPAHPRLFSPPATALADVRKPPLEVADALGLRAIDFELDNSPAAVERFLRRHPGVCWVKGAHYEAFPVRNATEVRAAGTFVTDMWGGPWHLEGHISGQECGIAFACRDGVLIDAAFMAKSLLTGDGKTWAGQLEDMPAMLGERLKSYVSHRGWNGGGEIELIRTWDGELFLLEVNPRFPAWIHGGTVAGTNLPAGLVAGARQHGTAGPDRAFTRVVEEVPLHEALGHVPFQWSQDGAVIEATKHPSAVRALARRHFVAPRSIYLATIGVPTTLSPALPDPSSAAGLETPCRWFALDVVDGSIAAIQRSLAAVGLADRCEIAYSIKTCPDPRVMAAAAAQGLAPEAISQDELRSAIKAGLDVQRAILNGPAKWWPEPDTVTCRAFFADSIPELVLIPQLLQRGLILDCEVAGVRLSPLHTPSRFGIALRDEATLSAIVAEVSRLRASLNCGWGAHFHTASSVIGERRWLAEAANFMAEIALLEKHLGPPALLDMGGGWHPNDRERMAPALAALVERSASAAELVVEPGKAIVESAGVIVSRVIGRRSTGASDLVVDAGLAELPESTYRSHPVFHLKESSWRVVPHGGSRILGRSCMEQDVLALDLDLREVEDCDMLAFADAGGYDASMAYDFGRGTSRAEAP